MKLEANNYPYPVLHPDMDDYLDNKAFSASWTWHTIDKRTGVLEVKYVLSNKNLIELIENGKAAYALHVEGKSSNYRKFICSQSPFITLQIEAESLSANLTINCTVISLVEIQSYTNDDFNDFYYEGKDRYFNIPKGSILAFVDTKELDLALDTQSNGLKHSYVRLCVGVENEKNISVDYTGDYIDITVPKALFVNFNGLKHQHQSAVVSACIFPALVYVYEKVKRLQDNSEFIEEYEALLWYRIWSRLLDDMNKDWDEIESIEFVQEILDNPLKDGLKSILEVGVIDDE